MFLRKLCFEPGPCMCCIGFIGSIEVRDIMFIFFLEYEYFSESCELLLIVFMSYIPHVALQYMSCALYYISGLT